MLSIYNQSVESMKTMLDVTIVFDATKSVEANALIKKAYEESERLIALISAWQEGTELYAVNQQAGIKPVRVGSELYGLVKRSLKISDITNGLFDVTFASIDKVWYFDRPMSAMPTQQAIEQSIRNINYKYIELDDLNQTIFITNKGTKIELGAIGKGFIATKMKAILQSYGVESGIINAGGDMVCWGRKPTGEQWKIGVADPNKQQSTIAWLPIENQALATSGSYERFTIIDGKKYSHIIHPKTGYPIEGLKSVTIISPDAELCDAIATSIFLLGKDAGLEFINQYEDLQCFLVDEKDAYHFSENLKQKQYVQ